MTIEEKNVLIIGLDGGTWTVLKPAMEQGYMPFLKSMVDDGASGVLESTIPVVTPAAWGVFQTGCNPAANGVLDFLLWDKETKRTTFVNSTHLRQTIWQILSQAGKQVVSLNVPMTYPPQPVNGYVISGILTPSMESAFTYPPELKDELLSHYPNYKILNLNTIPKECSNALQLQKFIGALIEVACVQAEAACYLIEKKRWDLFMLHFQVTDVLQHALWKYLDSTHPDFVLSKQKYIFSTFYKALDEQINKVIVCFKERFTQAITMIASDHGFESHYKRFNIANWLVQEQYQVLNKNRLNHPVKKFILSKSAGLLRCVPLKAAHKLRAFLNTKNRLIDFEQTKAICQGGCKEGLLYILENNPAIKLQLEKDIREKLSEITDPANSRPIIKNIYTTLNLYGIPSNRFLPDLIIEPENGYSIKAYYQHNKELITNVQPDDIMNIGKHHKEGIIIVSGVEINQHCSLRLKLIDIVPTLLYYFGIRPPKPLEGKICMDIFNKNFTAKTPALDFIETEASRQETEQNVYLPEDQKLIKKRLEDLGYL